MRNAEVVVKKGRDDLGPLGEHRTVIATIADVIANLGIPRNCRRMGDEHAA